MQLQQKLESDLVSYKNNLVKESIRMGHNDLGDFHYSRGDLQVGGCFGGWVFWWVCTGGCVWICVCVCVWIAIKRTKPARCIQHPQKTTTTECSSQLPAYA